MPFGVVWIRERAATTSKKRTTDDTVEVSGGRVKDIAVVVRCVVDTKETDNAIFVD